MKNRNSIIPDALYWASFNRFELRLTGECVVDCSASGDVGEAVEYWAPKVQEQIERDAFPLRPTADSIRAELREYGTWDSEELQDDEANFRRLVWIASCNVAEEDAPNCSEPVASPENAA